MDKLFGRFFVWFIWSVTIYQTDGNKEVEICYFAVHKVDIVTVVEKETATLPCNRNVTGDEKVIWRDINGKLLFLGEVPTQKSERYSLRMPSNDQWNIEIDQVQFTDQGVYECMISTQPPVLNQVVLVVQVPPTIQSPDTHSLEGNAVEDVELECLADGIPKPSATWLRVDNDIKDEIDIEDGIYIVDDVNSLIIRNMSQSEEGSYECHASNGAGDEAYSRFYLSYLEQPFIRGPLFENIRAESGGSARLPCVVENLGSKYKVRWEMSEGYVLAYGYDIFGSDRYSISRTSPSIWDLHIDPVTRWDSYAYYCLIVTDSYTKPLVTKTINLLVTEP